MSRTPRPLPANELAEVVQHARAAFEALRGKRIFITGGTGFFGHWLVESLLHANETLNLSTSAVLLTRNAEAFRSRAPHIAAHPAITLLEGDASSFRYDGEPCTHILHAATDSTGAQSRITEQQLADSVVTGTRRILALAREMNSEYLHYISTGAVYGRNVTGVTRIAESHPLSILHSSPENYEQAKLFAGELCLNEGRVFPLSVTVSQCFAFVGPHLPLDQHFAIGNFIADALAGRTIHIRGDGTPLRSYMYMTDLAAWIWTCLALGPRGEVFNVGSDEAISIRELAHLVANTLNPGLPLQIDGTPVAGQPTATYVPNTAKIRTALNLRLTVPLGEAVRRTAAWYSQD